MSRAAGFAAVADRNRGNWMTRKLARAGITNAGDPGRWKAIYDKPLTALEREWRVSLEAARSAEGRSEAPA